MVHILLTTMLESKIIAKLTNIIEQFIILLVLRK